MKLTLKNIGKIQEAAVEIKGITVIAGENNTGKSTVGKALFAIFSSLCNIETQIEYERLNSIEDKLDRIYHNHVEGYFDFDTLELARDLVSQREKYQSDGEGIYRKIVDVITEENENFEGFIDDVFVREIIERIRESLDVSDTAFSEFVLWKNLNAEFNGQVNNIFKEEEAQIRLRIKEEEMEVNIQENMIESIQDVIKLHTEAIYIDDPFIVDERRVLLRQFGKRSGIDHRKHLREKLFSDKDVNIVEEIATENKLKNIFKKLSLVCSGDIVTHRSDSLGYRRKNTDKVLNVRNLSTGLKTFVLLKKLLTSGVIEYNGTIILDEPEIHLHPQWQLVFAELIVLIQKEFGTHILLNTHSPYFLRAIEVYSEKYDVTDKCKYYLAENMDDIAVICDVSDRVDKIYQKLSDPFQQLEDLRWSHD